MGPFPVVRKVGNLAYKLKLPANILIYLVISITQLEPIPKDTNPYKRSIDLYLPPVENISNNSDPDNKDRLYEIERFIDKRITPTG